LPTEHGKPEEERKMGLPYLLLVPCGAALAARLTRHRTRWICAGVWAVAFAVVSLALAAFTRLAIGTAWPLVAVVSIIGFLGPDLWAGICSFARKPKVAAWVVGSAVVFFLVLIGGQKTLTQLAASITVLVIICYGLWVMIRPALRLRQKS
jgi:hypothetical protein